MHIYTYARLQNYDNFIKLRIYLPFRCDKQEKHHLWAWANGNKIGSENQR